MIQLILGGARSGKSRYGESVVAEFACLGQHCVYVATALGNDDEMRQRIAKHQYDRAHVIDPKSKIDWQLIEEPLFIAEALQAIDAPNQTIFVDCLTLLLTQHLLRDGQDDQLSSWLNDAATSHAAQQGQFDALSVSWEEQKSRLLAVLPRLQSNVVLVSNEVGSGIVPLGELSRDFVDQAGWLNQAIAQLADEVTLVVAGMPLQLKAASIDEQ
ncbi:bifunctional adenosylcobinamide kinase/adenosylcobinamide-phosphate guanylyltransferase [Shewanella maritima]|uniref:bifunctional adenosylcobinamide kinase/adenosylcobinamide-phosphate guanylyltransferase n=1 Tax=Shewanella maritima TaxID=2520507 RepID=UPI003736AFA5